MSHGPEAHLPEPPQLIRISRAAWITAVIAVLAGGAALAATFASGNAERAWAAWLIGGFYTLSLGVFGAVWVATLYLSGGAWSVTMRRIPEAMTAWIVPGSILMLVTTLGAHSLYHWSHADAVATDALLIHKEPFLNMGMFVGLPAISFVGWALFSWAMVRNSLQQDRTGAVAHTRRNRALSAAFVVFFALSYTGVSYIYLMSLEPHWFSTMYAVLTFTDMMQSGLAVVCLAASILVVRGQLGGFLGPEHLHSAGKMLFATTGFWAYIAFCQFLLIWYVNIPEETSYYLRRAENGWLAWSVGLPMLKFVVPFLLLVPRNNKRLPIRLASISVLILAAQFVEMFLMVSPSLGHGEHVAHAHLPLVEVLATAGFMGLFFIFFARALSSRPPVPLKDPELRECLHSHS
jgi:hypothetical protein